jgi:hypothetical protein
MIDLAGDGKPQVVAERKVVGDDEGLYAKPIVRYVWQIYARKDGAWARGPSLHMCAADPAIQDTSQPQVSAKGFDHINIDGREVNFFSSTRCILTDNTVTDPQDRMTDVAGEATRVWRVPVLFPYQGFIPADFMKALHTARSALCRRPGHCRNSGRALPMRACRRALRRTTSWTVPRLSPTSTMMDTTMSSSSAASPRPAWPAGTWRPCS